MEQDTIVAAILTSSLGAQGKFDDVSGAVATYHAILSALKKPHGPADDGTSTPIYVGQDEGVPEADNTAIRNLHF